MTSRIRPLVATLGLAALACLAFLLPALFNHHPFLFPDSLGYFRAGEATLHTALPLPAAPDQPGGGGINVDLKGVSTERSPFYGVLVALGVFAGSDWLVPLAQVGLCLIALLLSARHLGVRDPRQRWLLAGAIGLFSGLSVFATTLMPDVFAGLLILGIALLLARWPSMGIAERGFWLAVIGFACLVHKSHLAIGLSLLAAGLVLALLRRASRQALAPLLATLVIGGVGHLLVDLSVERVTGRPPRPVPFLLARMIGDGTVPAYLDQVCGVKDYRLCRYRDRMPMTENAFLWDPRPDHGLLETVAPEERAAILDESAELTKAALRAYPFHQLGAAATNALRQFFLVGTTEFAQTSGLDPEFAPGMRRTLVDYGGSRVMAGSMPMAGISLMMTITYLAALAALAGIALTRRETLVAPSPQATTRLLIVLGVLANAAICGAISGVFDRYQGRVAWLIPLLVLAWLLAGRSDGEQVHLPKPNTSW